MGLASRNEWFMCVAGLVQRNAVPNPVPLHSSQSRSALMQGWRSIMQGSPQQSCSKSASAASGQKSGLDLAWRINGMHAPIVMLLCIVGYGALQYGYSQYVLNPMAHFAQRSCLHFMLTQLLQTDACSVCSCASHVVKSPFEPVRHTSMPTTLKEQVCRCIEG